MRISEQRAGSWRELIVAGFFRAEIKPLAAILGSCFSLYLGDLVITTLGAAHNSVRPAHLADVL